MFITDFNQNNIEKIASLQKTLKEEFGIAIVQKFPSADKLKLLKDSADKKIVSIKGSSQQFQLEPEYIKYLGIRDLSATMLAEGMYAESPKYNEMKQTLSASVQSLMDSGYTIDEACGESMNRYRMDDRFAFDDEHVKTIVIKAAKDYMESCGAMESLEEIATEGANTDLNEYLLRELAKEVGMEIENPASIDAIEEKLNMFAEVSGKSRDSVVGFLNGLEEDAVANGIQMFGKKVAEQNKFTGARKDAIAQGKDSFEVDGESFTVTGDTKDEKKQAKESMFDDIIDEMINEEVEVEQAEVVMALRALADDVQEHVERVGRMINEDLPAILDQMKSEFGAEQAVQMKQTMEQTLTAVLDSNKAGKDGLDGVIAGLTGSGDGSMLGAEPGMEPGLGGEEEPALGGEEEPAMDNVPAAAGPEEEPLGRAPVEL